MTGRAMTAVIGVGALALGSAAVYAQANLTDLGAVAPGLGVNNSGQVVLQNYFYGNGTLTAFPTGFTGAGINASGEIVGSVAGPLTNPNPPFSCPYVSGDEGLGCAIGVWKAGTVTTYPIYQGHLDPAVGNQGLGINANGEIVGDWTFPHGEGGALLLSNGVFSSIAFPSSTCAGSITNPAGVAWAINDAGQIAGMLPQGTPSSCTGDAFLLSQGVYHDIGVGAALALNATGQVVGSLQFGAVSGSYNPNAPQPPPHAFVYDLSAGGTTKDLGTLLGPSASSTAYAINSESLVVGASYSNATPCCNSVATAFFYNGLMIDLDTFVSANDPLKPFVTLTDARGINDSGLIVVNGVDSRTQAKHAYLLQAPLIQVAPGPLSFPSEPIGSQSPSQTATFTNVGTTAIMLGATSVSSSSFVVQTNSCSGALAPSAQCAIPVVFAPTGAGSPSGTLTLIVGGVPIAVPLLSQLSVSITASSAAATTATGVTLTWSATAGTSCTATGGSAADGWVSSVPVSGSRTVKEAAPGTYTYGISCTAGPQTQTAQAAPVVVTWAPITATLTASATTLYTGQSTTLTWSSQNATTCASTGGGSNDGWPSSSRPTSGSVSITEPNPVITGGSETLTFTVTCTSSVSGLSGTSSVQVVQLDTPAPSSGGGGAFDPLTLLYLFGVLAAPWMRRLADRRGFELPMPSEE